MLELDLVILVAIIGPCVGGRLWHRAVLGEYLSGWNDHSWLGTAHKGVGKVPVCEPTVWK
jgi:hypothetical protein